jgi:acetyl-CoA C-acetyltransferase
VAAGVECVSRYGKGTSDGLPGTANPRFDDAGARSAKRAEGGVPAWSPAEGLPDIYIAMGQTAENVRETEGVSREDMDAFAALSQNRAVESQRNGFFEREITPVTLPDGRVIDTDDGPRPDTTVEALAKLKPAFRPDGQVTAGNSCPLNDGAAAVIVMSDTRARELGLTPLARVVATGVTALDPEIMGLGPIEASRQALKRANMSIADVDLVEINEAFATMAVASSRKLGFSHDIVNVNGGAIGLGHPIAASGARILVTLIHELRRRGGGIGVGTLCAGGGQGSATVVEVHPAA